MTETPLLEISGITKSYGSVVANDAISFDVGRGRIHALLGENGAGKSTLVKIIYGAVRPDAGQMRFDAAGFAPQRPSEARAAGIGMVFQHFSLFDALSVTDNIALGISPDLARGNLAGRIAQVADSYGLALEPGRMVGTLSVGQRQRVEIVRCLLQDPRLLIMDEPTSVLTPVEADTLFKTLRRLASEGRSVLYISHKLEEIRSLCDTATILRGGRVIATCSPADESVRSLAEMMLGAALERPAVRTVSLGAERLSIDRLTAPCDDPFGVAIDGVSLQVRAGEIVGIAGVAGNGQLELMQALIGEIRAARADAIRIDGKPVGRLGPDQRRTAGMGFVPEERLGHGAVPAMTLWENAILSDRPEARLASGGGVDIAGGRRFAQSVVETFDVRTTGVDRTAASLSGGNLQKFMIGREILRTPAVLIAAQPTWGVDAGAAALIHRALARLAANGAAVLIISQDLDELLSLADRVAVIANGRLSTAEPVATLTREAIGVRMGGIAAGRGEQHAQA